MSNKVNILLEILTLLEDDKTRMSTFIDPKVFGNISDVKRKEWYKKAQAEKSDELKHVYYSNRALGYDHLTALSRAKDSLRKERSYTKDKNTGKELPRTESEYSAFKDDDDQGEGGFDKVAGEKGVSPERKEAVTNLIKTVKTKFEDNPDAQKVLSVLLVQYGFDELVPSHSIPAYGEVSKLLKELETQGKRKWKSTPFAIATEDPPEGLGIPKRTYYKVMDYIKGKVGSLQHNESFLTGLSSLFGAKGGEKASFKLSNLEPMIDVIRRDLDHSRFKNHGLHLQGVTKEEGEDMLRNVPSVQHAYEGDALVIPVEVNTNLNQILRKAIPGKKVILFGYDKKPQPLRKGWEGFPYKVVSSPTVIGSYALSSESKAESLLKALSEGFQCNNYQHSTHSCNQGNDCQWGGFPSIGEDMNRECSDFK